MGNEGFVTHSLIFNNDELQVEISQGRFQKPIQAIDLASRILANNSPTNIETITVINIDQGVETLRASIPRQALVELVANGPLEEQYVEFNLAETVNDNAMIRDNDYLYPHFGWEHQAPFTRYPTTPSEILFLAVRGPDSRRVFYKKRTLPDCRCWN